MNSINSSSLHMLNSLLTSLGLLPNSDDKTQRISSIICRSCVWLSNFFSTSKDLLDSGGEMYIHVVRWAFWGMSRDFRECESLCGEFNMHSLYRQYWFCVCLRCACMTNVCVFDVTFSTQSLIDSFLLHLSPTVPSAVEYSTIVLTFSLLDHSQRFNRVPG
jgi:hypothetical protein